MKHFCKCKVNLLLNNKLIYREYILFDGEQGINPFGFREGLRKESQKYSYPRNKSLDVFS